MCKNCARPNNLAPKLDKMGIHILGTAAQNIDRAEDRSKFSAMCDELGIDQPEWSEFVKMEDGRSAFLDSAGEKKGHWIWHMGHMDGWCMAQMAHMGWEWSQEVVCWRIWKHPILEKWESNGCSDCHDVVKRSTDSINRLDAMHKYFKPYMLLDMLAIDIHQWKGF